MMAVAVGEVGAAVVVVVEAMLIMRSTYVGGHWRY